MQKTNTKSTDFCAFEEVSSVTQDLVERYLYSPSQKFETLPTICGPSFSVQFSVSLDQVAPPFPDGSGRFMICLNLVTLSEPYSWSFWIRYSGRSERPRADRKNRVTDPMRRVFSPMNKRTKKDSPLKKVQNVFVHPAMPWVDFEAQFALYLIQTKILQPVGNDAVGGWLLKYLEKNFRWGKQFALNIYGGLLANWRWPEDYRAWRKYIHRRLELQKNEGERQAYLDDEPDEVQDDRYLSKKKSPKQIRKVPLRTSREDSVLDARTVAEMAGVSCEYIYKLKRTGVLNVHKHVNGREVYRQECVEEFINYRKGKAERLLKRREVEETGKSPETARKQIYRTLGPVPRSSGRKQLPFKYREYNVEWTGWKQDVDYSIDPPFRRSNLLCGQWKAYSNDGKRFLYVSVPRGGEGEYKRGRKFDIELREGESPLTLETSDEVKNRAIEYGRERIRKLLRQYH